VQKEKLMSASDRMNYLDIQQFEYKEERDRKEQAFKEFQREESKKQQELKDKQREKSQKMIDFTIF